ncbi:RidA family protein [Bordetella petrii]|uniref:RidA family protein n=1 Tax=Bordetella petrii TaxID=94624 RepID=UPI001E314DF5|nr:RidA family protein [Bordetella petrii]MCD0504302.1 RidA family protein [Bordetella petrii]
MLDVVDITNAQSPCPAVPSGGFPREYRHPSIDIGCAMEYLESNTRYSKAVVHGDTVYLAGQVAQDPGVDAAGQARQVLEQIDELLGRCGSDKSRVISALVLLKDMRDLDAVNTIWDAWVVPGRMPTRTPMEARLADPRFLVEIQIVAAR